VKISLRIWGRYSIPGRARNFHFPVSRTVLGRNRCPIQWV